MFSSLGFVIATVVVYLVAMVIKSGFYSKIN